MKRLAGGAARFLPTALQLWVCGFDLSSYRAGSVYLASGGNAVQLLFPMVTSFALLGPFAMIGLYEMSRRLEKILIHLGHMFSTFLSLLLCPKLRCFHYVDWAISALNRHRAIAVLMALCRPAASIDS